MSSFGVYVGNDPKNVTAFENWFGAPTGHIMHYLNQWNWDAFDSSIDWAANLWTPLDKPVLWSVPLITEQDSTLEAAAAGAYKDHWRKAAEALAQTRPDDEVIYVRTGWEFNGDWFPWKAEGREEVYKEAFREFVETFREVSPRFKFEWTPNIGYEWNGMDPAKAYPGDDVVDVIGMDFYWSPQWHGTDPVAAWEHFRTREYGLEWHRDFAAAHGKPMAYSEWGVRSDNAGPYLELADQWFEENNVLYTTYWETNMADYPGQFSDGKYPTAGATFRSVFQDNARESDLDYSGSDGSGSGGGGEPAPSPDPDPTSPPDSSAPPPDTGTPPPGADPGPIATWQTGTGGNDALTGTDKRDFLNGAAGVDTATGGKGDDLYVVDLTADQVVEQAGEGIDSVESWAGLYALPAEVENLLMKAAYAQVGIGNALANRIVGGAGNNLIDGAGGDDTLTGGGGQDTFVFRPGSGHDVVTDFQAGAAGDRIQLDGTGLTSFADVQALLTATEEGTELRLSETDTVLLRGVEPEQIVASQFVFSGEASAPPPAPAPEPTEPAPEPTEPAPEPTEPTEPATPPAAPEPGRITTWHSGTQGYDVIVGTEAHDFLNGAGGVDRLTGRAGDDYYVVDDLRDTVVERAGEGHDRVESWANTYTLPENVEDLLLKAVYHQDGIGNDGANRIVGGVGENRIEGRGGDDELTGGGGQDVFLFRPGSGQDTVTDFEAANGDRIRLDGWDMQTFEQVQGALTQTEEGVLLTLSEHDSVLLRGVLVEQLTPNHFDLA